MHASVCKKKKKKNPFFSIFLMVEDTHDNRRRMHSWQIDNRNFHFVNRELNQIV